jgi:acetate kinase
MPATSYLYALPYHYYTRFKVRRYGFHGTSHRYVAFQYRKLRRDRSAKTSTSSRCTSATAARPARSRAGRSFDTSMGFTPLEGLVMGTRSGDLDPSVLQYLSFKEGLELSELETMLSKHSGLLGISGLTSDMQELLEEESEHLDRRVTLAIDMFCARMRKYVGAYLRASSAAVKALVFAGGIGENFPEIRTRICKKLDGLRADARPEAQRAARVAGRR